MLSGMVRQLPRRTPLRSSLPISAAPSRLDHVGDRHAQGIKLPTKDYWEFRDMITASASRGHSSTGTWSCSLDPN